jgi:hypothetical protein
MFWWTTRKYVELHAIEITKNKNREKSSHPLRLRELKDQIEID